MFSGCTHSCILSPFPWKEEQRSKDRKWGWQLKNLETRLQVGVKENQEERKTETREVKNQEYGSCESAGIRARGESGRRSCQNPGSRRCGSGTGDKQEVSGTKQKSYWRKKKSIITHTKRGKARLNDSWNFRHLSLSHTQGLILRLVFFSPTLWHVCVEAKSAVSIFNYINKPTNTLIEESLSCFTHFCQEKL